MQKFGFLFLAICFLSGGCQVFRRSETWDRVRRVRVETRNAADPSAAYAQQLHGVLASSRVPHKIVTYQYRYTTNLREEAIGTRTAVIYRDDTHRASPWWLTDERVRQPVWLPDTDLPKQVRFYVRRHAEVVEVREFPGGMDGKTTVAEKPLRSSGRERRGDDETVRNTSIAKTTRNSRQPLLSRIWSTMMKPLRLLGWHM